MAGEFVSWAILKAELRDAMASGDIDRFFKTRIENSRQMQVAYDSMALMKFYDWVCLKATEEANSFGEGCLLFTVMGGSG